MNDLPNSSLVSWDEAVDIVVVGYGYAGAIAAIEASDAGRKVLLVEKMPYPGGISICSGGNIRIADDAAKAFKKSAAKKFAGNVVFDAIVDGDLGDRGVSYH